MRIAPGTILTVALLGFNLAARAQNGSAPVIATDLLKIHRLSDVALSPDGRQVLYALTSIVDTSATDDAYEYRTHLHVVDGNGSFPPRQLTRGEKSASDAAWHPDGDRIAFVRQVDGKPQIFILPLLGGEAIQITKVKTGASSPAWSPDGSRILFASSLKEKDVRELTGNRPDWLSERPGRSAGDTEEVKSDVNGSVAEIRAWLDENAEEGNPRVFSRMDFLGEMDLETTPSFQHYFVVDVDSVEAEPVLVTRNYADYSGAAWISEEMIVVAGTARTDV
ncbi:MAG: S9 family peptidase, partial [Rhodothermales bacterium]